VLSLGDKHILQADREAIVLINVQAPHAQVCGQCGLALFRDRFATIDVADDDDNVDCDDGLADRSLTLCEERFRDSTTITSVSSISAGECEQPHHFSSSKRLLAANAAASEGLRCVRFMDPPSLYPSPFT
jgi:hypothetical protein